MIIRLSTWKSIVRHAHSHTRVYVIEFPFFASFSFPYLFDRPQPNSFWPPNFHWTTSCIGDLDLKYNRVKIVHPFSWSTISPCATSILGYMNGCIGALHPWNSHPCTCSQNNNFSTKNVYVTTLFPSSQVANVLCFMLDGQFFSCIVQWFLF